MPIALGAAAVNMFVATGCGALIGSERQVRQRMAGLRTNALVALGAAGFVTFSQLIEHDASPSRVAAQVVSGIGFLGAGIIFREGFNVHGLNTAATLWCSAGVGLLAGVGAWPFALALTGMVVFVNLGLRPLVKWLKRHTRAGVPVMRYFRVVLRCSAQEDAAMRGMLLHRLGAAGIHITEVASNPVDGSVELVVSVSGDDGLEQLLQQVVLKMAAEPAVARIRWMPSDEV
jgi:putative Mg2+ transporter-C (MgtC) family protein